MSFAQDNSIDELATAVPYEISPGKLAFHYITNVINIADPISCVFPFRWEGR